VHNELFLKTPGTNVLIGFVVCLVSAIAAPGSQKQNEQMRRISQARYAPDAMYMKMIVERVLARSLGKGVQELKPEKEQR
jgi:hypothetical protein